MALLALLEQERGWARPLIVEHEQLAVQLAAERVRGALGEVLDEARGQVIVGSQIAPPAGLIAELLSSAVVSVVRARMLAGEGASLVDLAPSLMEHVIEPYLGTGTQLADAASSPSRAVVAAGEARVLPVGARPRVLRALEAILFVPGLSGRDLEVAVTGKDREGSRIWQLLKSLEQRGLIENARVGGVCCQPNVWRLTSYGHRALQLLDGTDAAAARPRERARRAGLRHLSPRPAARPVIRSVRTRGSAAA